MAALTDNHDWQGRYWHTSAKSSTKLRGRAETLRERLEWGCKNTAWLPFTQDELKAVSARWKNNKSTGPDQIAHEALRILKQRPVWEHRLLEMLNDALYTGRLPAAVEKGPKEGTPQHWGDTRPITLSSAILKPVAQ